MSRTSRLAIAAAACLLTGSAALAQTQAPTAGFKATGMDGKTLDGAALNGAGTPGAGLGGAGTGGTGPAEPGKVPATGSGMVGGSAGLQPAPGTGTKAAP